MAPGRRVLNTRNRTIGLLGGSFNPAHEGHLHLTLEALKALPLDEVWWLAAPQNPLKPQHGMAPYDERLRSARALAAGDRRIRVSDFEAREGTRYSVDTVRALKRRYPRLRFVWLMGADSFLELPRWREWDGFIRETPIAVFERPSYLHRARRGKAALALKKFLINNRRLPRRLAPPALVFIPMRHNYLSSTLLRKNLEIPTF